MSAKPTADGTPQKRLNVDVPEELANQFKAYAALQGKSQREIVIAFMQRCVHRSRPGCMDPDGAGPEGSSAERLP